MGVVIVGGTIFSLVLTLFIIPALYFMWSKARKHYPEFDHIEEYETSTKKSFSSNEMEKPVPDNLEHQIVSPEEKENK